MKKYIFKDGKQLRCGYTTGTCAAAAAKAAATKLLRGAAQSGSEPSEGAEGSGSPGELEKAIVSIILPDGGPVHLEAEYIEAVRGTDGRLLSAACSVRKDAGDDSDVTDGMMICARVSIEDPIQKELLQVNDRTKKEDQIHSHAVISTKGNGETKHSSIVIDGGEGVGRVTKPGLDQPVGAAAINSVPREMIRREVQAVCDLAGLEGDIFVEIFVPGGEEIALRTFNPMLGVEGGISILGTSGIVEPMSDDAIVETIRTEIRVKKGPVLAVVPGNYGMKFALEDLKLSEDQIVKCSNFIGAAMDAFWEYGLSGILLIGNAGKLIKLASGIMNTHSSHADARMETIIACSLEAGAPLDVLHEIAGCVTTEAAFSLLKKTDLAQQTMDIAAERAARHMARRVRGELKTGVVLFSSESDVMSLGGDAEELLKILRV